MRTIECQDAVITGMGAITPIGLNAREFRRNAVMGESGIDYLPKELQNDDVVIGAIVKDFNGLNYFEKKELKKIHKSVQFGYAALLEALIDSELNLDNEDPEMVASVIGTGMAGASHIANITDTIRNRGARWISPFDLLNIIPCRINTVCTFKQPIFGPAFSINAACTSSGASAAEAVRLIRLGEADVVFWGGVDAAVNEIGIGTFTAMKALSTFKLDPRRAIRPFDVLANGIALGEGAGVFVMESKKHAEARGAHIYGEVLGYRQCSDSTRRESPEDLTELGFPATHIRNSDTEPSVAGAVACMTGALRDAGVRPEDVDLISSHGTGTYLSSSVEAWSIRKIFGENGVRVKTLKATAGHMVGAVGAEIIDDLYTIHEGIISPNPNLENPVRGDVRFVGKYAERHKVNIILKNFFGFGGPNASLVIGRYTPSWEQKAA